jgi:hypothetical protein
VLLAVSTSLACAWYFRHRLRERTATPLFAALAPVLGAAMLLWLGVGPPLVIGVVEETRARRTR